MQIDFNELTQDKIVELSKYIPGIRQLLILQDKKEITWEQCCYAIIMLLVQTNNDLMKQLIAVQNQSFHPAIKIDIDKLSPEQLTMLSHSKIPEIKPPCNG